MKTLLKAVISSTLRIANRIWYHHLAPQWQSLTSDHYTEWLCRHVQQCGTDVRVNGPIVITDPRFLAIGNNVHIGSNCYFRSQGGLIIGDNTHISRDVVIYTDSHNYQGTAIPYDATSVKSPVIIERNVWIGMGVKIRPGVRIGEGAIVGIGTVVTRDIESFEIVGAPHPNRIKERDRAHYQRLDQRGTYGAVNGAPWTPSVGRKARRGAGDGEDIVFVSSTGRSGSESIARVLDNHPEITAQHEPQSNLIRLSTEFAHGKKNACDVKRELLALYHHASTLPVEKRVYVESDLKLSNLIPILQEIFPAAKFLWLIRNGKDVIASTYARTWFSEAEYLPTQEGKFGKIESYSEFRLVGHLADPEITEKQWAAMSAFERNCWYWAFWNSNIERYLALVPTDRKMILRLEDFQKACPELLKWMGVDSRPLTMKVHNRAEKYKYKPYMESQWTAAERDEFSRWCDPLMARYYAGKSLVNK